jgi:hypothetical protein
MRGLARCSQPERSPGRRSNAPSRCEHRDASPIDTPRRIDQHRNVVAHGIPQLCHADAAVAALLGSQQRINRPRSLLGARRQKDRRAHRC